MKKSKKIDQMSDPFFTKWQENDFSLVFLSRFAVFTGLWKVNSQAYSDQTFSRGFNKVGTNYRIRSIKAPVLITTPPNQIVIRTPVKNWYWNNITPSRIEPHPRTKYINIKDWLLQQNQRWFIDPEMDKLIMYLKIKQN